MINFDQFSFKLLQLLVESTIGRCGLLFFCSLQLLLEKLFLLDCCLELLSDLDVVHVDLLDSLVQLGYLFLQLVVWGYCFVELVTDF